MFYPDIGMSPSSYFLAFARLAPVQAVSWGHPDSTGLSSMDYFVSATFIEPEDAEDHYTERLIRLNRIPCFYSPLHAPIRVPDRLALGLPESGTLYGCPQSLFKFHPDFDAVLGAIAEGDPTGYIVILAGKVPTWAELLRTRWANTYPILLDRTLFLPMLPHDRFMALMAHIDVLLDPLHFGSGNTLYEGMAYGTPVVTWPGRFMRGRIVAGAYRQMGIADAPIAESIEEYAALALALGRDPARRQRLRRASIVAAARELFADTRAVREFETFLVAAVEAAGRGEKLPPGWRPDIQAKDSPDPHLSDHRRRTSAAIYWRGSSLQHRLAKPIQHDKIVPSCRAANALPCLPLHDRRTVFRWWFAPPGHARLAASAAEAAAMPCHPLEFVQCPRCTHVWNRAFSYDAIPYETNPNRMFNAGIVWSGHLAAMRDLLLARLPPKPTVVEIGCGEGHFLRGLAQACDAGHFVGFDPNASSQASARVEFSCAFFRAPRRHTRLHSGCVGDAACAGAPDRSGGTGGATGLGRGQPWQNGVVLCRNAVHRPGIRNRPPGGFLL